MGNKTRDANKRHMNKSPLDVCGYEVRGQFLGMVGAWN